nr:unnamed protein product [Digitaria exilis]
MRRLTAKNPASDSRQTGLFAVSRWIWLTANLPLCHTLFNLHFHIFLHTSLKNFTRTPHTAHFPQPLLPPPAASPDRRRRQAARRVRPPGRQPRLPRLPAAPGRQAGQPRPARPASSASRARPGPQSSAPPPSSAPGQADAGPEVCCPRRRAAVHSR